MFILSKFIRNVLNQCLIIFFKTLTLQVRVFFSNLCKKKLLISKKLLLKICFRKKIIYLKSKNVTKKLVQFYETKPAFFYSLDLVIQIVKEKYSILNILKPSVCDVLFSISSNAKPIQYLPNRFKVLAWKVKSQAFCCMYIYNIYTKFYPVTSSLLHYQR